MTGDRHRAQRSQPIWVEDVAAYFARAVDAPDAANRTFELGGPDAVDLERALRADREACSASAGALVHVPVGLARAGARLTQRLPGAPLTRDQVTMLEGARQRRRDTDAGSRRSGSRSSRSTSRSAAASERRKKKGPPPMRRPSSGV